MNSAEIQTKPFLSGLIRLGMLSSSRRWKIKEITSEDAKMAWNKREILAIYMRIVVGGKKKMRRRTE